MCWLTNYKPKKETAKEDIEVYKIFLYIDFLYSPIFGTIWEPNFEYSTYLGEPYNVNVKNNYYCNYSINEGYHSLEKPPVYSSETLSWRTATNHPILESSRKSMHVVCKCIIPRGAYYYKNEDGEIVSDRLKVIEELNS